ncbi:MAG: fumarylacetoacetate hydrolase family protein [Rhodospirillaceae bacterium]|mgnify:CR=1 FL=1|jgi:2-keto-4-pentenoate hydratase/2-oxohepta-3-ene-1,7-dioic acid hydratase in catechol pathway|nr:fumarylacetoacetate hydrolase family protein [Rhodospirillaceae bacterium]MBT5457434.1 fumarylacetoacetate hydrolase family protein [Rhodospirillaceae bacterium]
MKLARFGERGAERPGLIDDNGTLRDLSGEIEDITPQTLAPAMLDRLRGLDAASLPAVTGEPRMGVPVGGIPKIVAIGQNYLDHIKEMGYEPPAEPVIFVKAISSLCGATDPVIKPKTSTKLDYEVEMAAVIGRTAINVSEAEALDYVAGYALMNDGSERAYQREREGGTTKGKSADTLGPLGPWLVTADEVGDPQNVRLWTKVNGEDRQDGHTSNMVFGFAQLIAYVTEFMSLQPGDVLTTGSPHGVAAGFNPPKWLQPGDIVEMGADGLGTQRHEIVAYRD